MRDEVPGESIARRDEILELLYWLEGEGFHADATLGGIQRFVSRPEEQIRETLRDLVRRGDVELVEGAALYRLTEVGRREAARRFAAEFAGMLNQGHGECNDPTCDCHANPGAAAECHARTHGSGPP